MENEFTENVNDGVIDLLLGTILDCKALEYYFGLYHPDIVIHAAAYKHVLVADRNPSEVIKCNVLGTLNILNISNLFASKYFVFLSSDKAVNPSSVMGVSKRIGEIIVQYFDLISDTNFTITRFGNVFGSSGSVSQIFENQILNEKKVTITHPEMERFFLSLSDAANLILSSILLCDEGKIFLCDMKQSIKITELALEMIRAFGLSENEIDIQYTSARKGESLFEELTYPGEELKRTSIESVLTCFSSNVSADIIEKTYNLLQNLYSGKLTDYILKIVPEYKTKKVKESLIRK